MMSYSKTTLVAAGITSTDGFFKKLRCFYLEGWIVQLVISEDSTSVSFLTWNGKGDIAFSSSETQSRVVAPAVAFMPNLQELEFDVPVEALYRYGRNGSSCANLGLEHLASLRQVKVNVDCQGAIAEDVEKAEAELRHAAQLHPNRPIFEIQRKGQYDMRRPSRSEDDEEANK